MDHFCWHCGRYILPDTGGQYALHYPLLSGDPLKVYCHHYCREDRRKNKGEINERYQMQDPPPQ